MQKGTNNKIRKARLQKTKRLPRIVTQHDDISATTDEIIFKVGSFDEFSEVTSNLTIDK